MTMPIIVMTKKLIRSAVTDNDWVCQMDWVPALSQVSWLLYSIYFFDFQFVLVSLCFMTNPRNQKYEEEENTAGKSAGGWCLHLFLQSIFFLGAVPGMLLYGWLRSSSFFSSLIWHHIIIIKSWVAFLQGFLPINPSGRVNSPFWEKVVRWYNRIDTMWLYRMQ